MRLWYQSFTDLTVFPLYDQTLIEHIGRIRDPETTVVVHGLKPGTYLPDVAPIDANRDPYVRMLGELQICEAAAAAERAGYDAFVLGCIFDPGLQAARARVGIPVISMAETTMSTASQLGRSFSYVVVNQFQKMMVEDLAQTYGFHSRLASVEVMSPGFSLFDLERPPAETSSIRNGFVNACKRALDAGAEVIIPGDGVLNEFLFRAGLLQVEGAVILDAIGITLKYAEFIVRAETSLGQLTSHRHRYFRSPAAVQLHARQNTGLEELDEARFSGCQTPICGIASADQG